MVESKTLYIAEDDPDDRMLLVDAIRSIDPGIKIIEAENGKELLNILQTNNPTYPSLVVLDVNMPKLNGLETLARLRSMPQLAWLPAVMLSTSNNSDLIETAKSLGALYYFIKPTQVHDLLNLANRLILA